MNLILKHRLMNEEGFRDRLYKDTEGFLTIGYGWCPEKNPMSEELAEIVLEYHINQVEKNLLSLFTISEWYLKLDPVRQSVIMDLAYNMGLDRLLGFQKMIDAIKENDFDTAANEMLNSKWHLQVGKRAEALADIFRKGQS